MEEKEEEEIRARHRKEQKELRSKLQQLKKEANSSNKQRKKEIMAECERLEMEMEKRHGKELLERSGIEGQAESISTLTLDGGVPSPSQDVDAQETRKISRQAQRKMKKQEEMERVRREAEEESLRMPDKKLIESELFANVLSSLNLRVHSIIPDGHCLYNALAHQLRIHYSQYDNVDYVMLRKLTAEYLRVNEEEYLPFVLASVVEEDISEDLHLVFLDYCDKIENTATWGGQLEIRAMSNHFKVPVKIIMVNTDTCKHQIVTIGEEFINAKSDNVLHVSYHRHEYGLGEHYNSLIIDSAQ